jgi:hypothetical protein
MRRVLFDRLQNSCGSVDGGINQILLRVFITVVKRTRCVNHCFQSIDLDSFIEGTFFRNVFYNAEIKLGSRCAWMDIPD